MKALEDDCIAFLSEEQNIGRNRTATVTVSARDLGLDGRRTDILANPAPLRFLPGARRLKS